MQEDKRKAIEMAMAQIDKQHGRGTLFRYGDRPVVMIGALTTGSLGLDKATGVNGLPKGRIIEIFGPESSGKTTLALSTIGQAQKAGGVAAFIDAEHALDVGYATKLGVNMADLLISQPDNGEQALEIAEILIRSAAVDIVVVDSVAALVPKAELEGDMGASLPGLQARLMSQAMRKLTAAVSKSNTTVIFINQLRIKIGVMFGSPETTTGGNALKFYSSMRIDVRRGDQLKDKTGNVIGGLIKVKVVKNKVAPPFKSCVVTLFFETGISRNADVLDIAVQTGVVEKSGSWYSFAGDKIGQGIENAREYLDAHPDVASEIEKQIKDKELPDSPEAKVAAEQEEKVQGDVVAEMPELFEEGTEAVKA